MHNFCFWGLSLLIDSSHVHKIFNVKLDDHALCLYNVQNKDEKNIYGISFELATSSQTKLQL
jgi:hypothetical protein